MTSLRRVESFAQFDDVRLQSLIEDSAVLGDYLAVFSQHFCHLRAESLLAFPKFGRHVWVIGFYVDHFHRFLAKPNKVSGRFEGVHAIGGDQFKFLPGLFKICFFFWIRRGKIPVIKLLFLRIDDHCALQSSSARAESDQKGEPCCRLVSPPHVAVKVDFLHSAEIGQRRCEQCHNRSGCRLEVFDDVVSCRNWPSNSEDHYSGGRRKHYCDDVPRKVRSHCGSKSRRKSEYVGFSHEYTHVVSVGLQLIGKISASCRLDNALFRSGKLLFAVNLLSPSLSIRRIECVVADGTFDCSDASECSESKDPSSGVWPNWLDFTERQASLPLVVRSTQCAASSNYTQEGRAAFEATE